MGKTNKKIMWRNKWSGEQGYVKSVSPKNGCFYNTFNVEEAKNYTNDKAIEKDLAFLDNIGETELNEFKIV